MFAQIKNGPKDRPSLVGLQQKRIDELVMKIAALEAQLAAEQKQFDPPAKPKRKPARRAQGQMQEEEKMMERGILRIGQIYVPIAVIVSLLGFVIWGT